MTVSSLTPDDFPGKCPLCNAKINIERLAPEGEALCPNCGCNLGATLRAFGSVTEFYQRQLGTASITAKTRFNELGADSLDTIEMVMELQEEFEMTIPDDAVQRMETIGDVIQYIRNHQRGAGD